MHLKNISYIFFIILSFNKLIAMNLESIPKQLKKDLKENKANILSAMKHINQVVAVNSLGTFHNPLRMFFYENENKDRKSIPYFIIDQILDSDDEEYNIGGMYDGRIRVPNCPSEKDSLNPKNNNHHCCWCLIPFFCQ